MGFKDKGNFYFPVGANILAPKDLRIEQIRQLLGLNLKNLPNC
jgi:hypothetical protein